MLYMFLLIIDKGEYQEYERKKMEEKEIEELSNEYEKIKNQILRISAYILIVLVVEIYAITLYNTNHCCRVRASNIQTAVSQKPIIYIYPESEQEVTIKLDKTELLTATYPKYETEWKVLAKPDGTLIDLKTNRELYGLYWEAENEYKTNMSEGFVIKGEDTASFLEEKLEILGLTDREIEEFIIYWLPKMEQNNYNYIYFENIDEINQGMNLEISPEPDTIIRIMMEFKALDKPITVEEQKIEEVERKGYTVVEWGGKEIK